MKYSLFIAGMVFSLNAFSASGEISLKCEEGIGNLDQPTQYVHIEGTVLDVKKRGEMNLQEKSALKVSVVNNGQLVQLSNNEYRIETQGDSSIKIVMLSDKSRFNGFEIRDAGLPELSIRAIGASKWTGNQKVVGHGICWGFSPYPRQ